MSAKHTAGPWTALKCNCGEPLCKSWLIHAEPGVVVDPDLGKDESWVGTVHTKGNARLVRAAPELLTELRQVAVELEEASKIITAAGMRGVGGIYREAHTRVRSTIAKAEGT